MDSLQVEGVCVEEARMWWGITERLKADGEQSGWSVRIITTQAPSQRADCRGAHPTQACKEATAVTQSEGKMGQRCRHGNEDVGTGNRALCSITRTWNLPGLIIGCGRWLRRSWGDVPGRSYQTSWVNMCLTCSAGLASSVLGTGDWLSYPLILSFC